MAVDTKRAETTKEIVERLASEIGKDKCDDSKSTRIAYRIGHGPEAFLHDLDYFTPGVVVWPETVEDVQKIIAIANKTRVPIVPIGGRTISYGPEAMKGCIVADMARMNKVLKFDKANFRVTAEAGTRIIDLETYLERKGYMLLEMPALPKIATLGARASLHGFNKWSLRWGNSGDYVKGLEIVLPTGEVVQVGRGTNGMKIPSKSAVAYDLMNLFIGSKGTLGIITKVTEKVIKTPPLVKYGAMAFKTREDGIQAYLDLKVLSSSTGTLWRTKGYPKFAITFLTKEMVEKKWPEDIEWVTDYHVAGEPEVVRIVEKHAEDICKSHNGFWRDDLPPIDFIINTNKSSEQMVGTGSTGTDRVKNGGVGYRITPMDPGIPDSKLVEYFELMWEHVQKLKDAKIYPHLASDASNIIIGDLLVLIPLDESFSKSWVPLNTSWEFWNKNTPARMEFLSWFREYAEIVWKVGGTLSATHSFVPRDLEVELIKRELGENEYKLMERIKDLLDPNHIMNPKVKFKY